MRRQRVERSAWDIIKNIQKPRQLPALEKFQRRSRLRPLRLQLPRRRKPASSPAPWPLINSGVSGQLVSHLPAATPVLNCDGEIRTLRIQSIAGSRLRPNCRMVLRPKRSELINASSRCVTQSRSKFSARPDQLAASRPSSDSSEIF